MSYLNHIKECRGREADKSLEFYDDWEERDKKECERCDGTGSECRGCPLEC